jgi:hypothetical protein
MPNVATVFGQIILFQQFFLLWTLVFVILVLRPIIQFYIGRLSKVSKMFIS